MWKCEYDFAVGVGLLNKNLRNGVSEVKSEKNKCCWKLDGKYLK